MGIGEDKANRRVRLNVKIKIFANKGKSKKARINSAFEALDLELQYKRENPTEFEEIFSALERFSQKRNRYFHILQMLKMTKIAKILRLKMTR